MTKTCLAIAISYDNACTFSRYFVIDLREKSSVEYQKILDDMSSVLSCVPDVIHIINDDILRMTFENGEWR